MTASLPTPPAATPRRTVSRRRDGEWGVGASLLSLIILGAHYLWWDQRLGTELDPVWADEYDPAFEVALGTITSTTTVVSAVAAVLVVVVPAVTWALRRSPGWPPLVITTVALVTTWIVTYPSTMVLRPPGI